MSPDRARALYPTGTDRTVTLDGQGIRTDIALDVTIIDHSATGIYAGLHPHLLFLPYAEIKEAS